MLRVHSTKTLIGGLVAGLVALAPARRALAGEDRSDLVADEAHDVAADIVQVEGDRVYHLHGVAGLLVYDVARPESPRLLGRYPIVGWPKGLVVRHGVASVVMGWSDVPGPAGSSQGGASVLTVDVRDPARPRLVGTRMIDGVVRDARATTSALYVVSETQDDGLEVTVFPLDGPAAHAPRTIRRPGASPALRVVSDRLVLASAHVGRRGTRVEVLAAGHDGLLDVVGSVELPATLEREDSDVSARLDAADPAHVRVLGCRTVACGAGDPLEVTTIDVTRADLPRVVSTHRFSSPGRWLATRFVGPRLYVSERGWLVDPSAPATLTIVGLDANGGPPDDRVVVPGAIWNVIPAGSQIVLVTTRGDAHLRWEQLVLETLAGEPHAGGTAPRLADAVVAGGWASSPAQASSQALAVCGGQLAVPFRTFAEGSPNPRGAVALFDRTPAGLSKARDVDVAGVIERLACVRGRLFAVSTEGLWPVGGAANNGNVASAGPR